MYKIKSYLKNEFNFDEKVIDFCFNKAAELEQQFRELDGITEYNQYKVLRAMQKNRLSESCFGVSTGYGYNDIGRDTLEKIYADVFGTELALVRPQIISGTHALTVALFGNLRYGDELLYVTGAPYDTLQGVIGCTREVKGSLSEHGIIYRQTDLLPDGSINYDGIAEKITDKTRIAAIQRSKGYEYRPSLTVNEIEKIIKTIKAVKPDVICMVDNCYGEFTDTAEPSEAGADLTVGSLIKNPGGGLAPVGGYIVGKEEYVENAAYRLTSPGMGREVGPGLGVITSLIQGLFLAPGVVNASLKGAIFASAVFKELGFDVMPEPDEKRADIVQAIQMRTPEGVIAFCEGIQMGAAVDSFVKPEPWDMPGYDCEVIMAAGAFVQGSSIELSADAPMKEPYTVFMQGGLTWHHAKIGIMMTVNNLYKKGLINL